MSTLYLFQRLGIDPSTGSAYEAQTVSLTERQAVSETARRIQESKLTTTTQANVSKKRVQDEKPLIKEEIEEPTLKRERSEGAPEPDFKPAPPNKKVKRDHITTYGGDFQAAVIELFIRCIGPKPQENQKGGGTWTDKNVDIILWGDAIVPMVEDIEDEKERRRAAHYAINASIDLYLVYAAEWDEERQELEIVDEMYVGGIETITELERASDLDYEISEEFGEALTDAKSSTRLSDLPYEASKRGWQNIPEDDDDED